MSVLLLGLGKMALAVLLGPSLLALLQHFPSPLLAVLLLMSGLELASTCRDMRPKLEVVVVLLTAVGSLTGNTLVGFVVGAVAHALMLLGTWLGARVWGAPGPPPRG